MRHAALFLSLATLAGCSNKPTTGAMAANAERNAAADQGPRVAKQAVGPGVADRKIIYTATIDLGVKDVDVVATQVNQLAQEYGGYVAKSDVSGEINRSRLATWTLKIQADKFAEAVTKLTELGEVTRKATDSQDVTEEFVDLEARAKNFKAEETKLNELLAKAAGSIEDLLKVREQIKGIRGEIERVEGRMKYLTQMSDFSTITLSAREEVDYVPEPSGEAATFGEQASARLAGSWDNVVRAAKGFALFCVGITPYLPILLVGGLVVWLVVRRIGRRDRRSVSK